MGEGYAWIVIAPVAGLAADVAVHLLLARLQILSRLYPRMLAGAAAGLVIAAGLTLLGGMMMAAETADLVAFGLMNAIAYAALAFGYVNFIQLNVSALRVRMAIELLEAPAGLTLEDLCRLYGARQIVEQRLARLVRGRQIEERDGRYYSRVSGVYLIAFALDLAKRAILGRRMRDVYCTRSLRKPDV